MTRRRLVNAAAAVALATGVLGIGPANADNASQICSSVNDGGFTHGACVSLASAGNTTAFLSDACGEPGAPQALGTTNRGQCLKVARSLLP